MSTKHRDDPVEAPSGETQLIATEAATLGTFVKNLFSFLTEARNIERDAVAQLAIARTFLPPKTAEEDTKLKDAVRVFSSKKKAAEEHWNVCGVASRFHRRLTAGRGRAVDPLDEAIGIGTGLHTEFVTVERRKAEAAERKLREQAEQQAREAHEAELRRLEADAVRLEEQNENLSEREQLFITGWFDLGGDAYKAARIAGYKDPVAAAARLIASPKIKAAIEAQEEARALRQQAEAIRKAPVEVPEIRIEPAVDTNGDRTRASADLVDEEAFIAAVLAGKHGIPSDVLTVNRPKLNDYARSLGPRIELWPGVRFVRKTTIV